MTEDPRALVSPRHAAGLEFSDPAAVAPPPAHAIGLPDRSPDCDPLPGFRNPPPGYGEVAFYWWLGDPLTKARLAWQLDRLAACEGVTGLQINYAHGYRDGGISFGLTLPSEPPLFSEAWWGLVGWFMQEAKRRGMSVSLSDYTLGIGQGWKVDELLREHPQLAGAVLHHQTRDVEAGEVVWAVLDDVLMVAAYALHGGAIVAGSAVDLRGSVADGVLRWTAPGPRHRLVWVAARRVKPSLDPMNPQSGALYADKFFGAFERRHPGESGKGLNFFFSDELGFGVDGNLWTPRLADEFRRRKGYDLLPELPALFLDVGNRTSKVRLDYRDVMVALEEESFFKPVFDWHQSRGMVYGCDHGGRGRNVTEFGDYFRTQRWNQGPGCDQPRLACDLIKNKVAASIAHLYERPRVWLEGFHSSGWGTSTAGLTDATFANFAQGQNLLSLHGLYYSTHGGFWEWAPPCNHFRMPYWEHMRTYMAMVRRLSYLLSQGRHRCDVAILYPVAPMEAGLGGEAAKAAAFGAGETLYARGIDFDFMDFESLDRAVIAGKELRVSGEVYRVLVLPAMRAIRWSTLRKAVEFQEAGGLVVVLGAVPEATDRAGAGDPEVDARVARLVTRVETPEEIATLVGDAFPRDFAVLAPAGVAPNFMHRRIGVRDVFMVHNAPKDTLCWFRATGRVELWDPWSGTTRPLPVLDQTTEGTKVRLPLTETDAQLVVFSSGEPVRDTPPQIPDRTSTIDVAGDWGFELRPTMDNRFGDYRWPPTPAFIGAEARRFRYADEAEPDPGWELPDVHDSTWSAVTASFGPVFWQLGPLPAEADLDVHLSGLTRIDPAVPVETGGKAYYWKPYVFSWRWGVEGDPGPQGYHGLKGKISDDFIVIGAGTRTRDMGHEPIVAEPDASRFYLWTAAISAEDDEAAIGAGGHLPAAAWVNGRRLADLDRPVALKSGANPLLLRYDQSGRGHFVLVSAGSKTQAPLPGGLAMRWFDQPGVVPFDARPEDPSAAGWYRFSAPPGLRALTVTVRGEVQAWIDGRPGKGRRQAEGWRFELPEPVRPISKVALRVVPDRGCYGGAALPEPVVLECGKGLMPVGDWSEAGVLENYSGGAWYRKCVRLTSEQAGGEVTLDLGKVVASAEVHVNGQKVGVRIAPPWRLDLTGFVISGENRIEVLVYNTLANHYQTVPTDYRGDLTSGLLGPVSLEFRQRSPVAF